MDNSYLVRDKLSRLYSYLVLRKLLTVALSVLFSLLQCASLLPSSTEGGRICIRGACASSSAF
ncbi:hypothetical protein YC2023_008322 [Brassica napus]